MLENLNDWTLGIIVFISQTAFLWLRTLNVVYTSRLQLLPSVLTGIGIALSWLIAVSIGVDAVLQLKVIPIICHVLGGVLGTVLALYKKKENEINKKN